MTAILGIETSCDETAASVVLNGREVLSNIVSSQVAKHAPFGGVVPELAAREHLNAISFVCEQALSLANFAIEDISAVAVTNGPGLIPSLLVGLNFAKGLASARNIPLIGINHFLAHIYGAFLDGKTDELNKPENFPVIALVVSGGHTALVLFDQNGYAKVIGNTLDDASGEALDKAAKLLGLPYPGGPVIEKIALNGNSQKIRFPRSLTGVAGKALEEENRFNFSFSGVKTALYYYCEKNRKEGHLIEGELLNDIVASYQEAVLDVLCRKTVDATNFFRAKSVVACGGVACNSKLRSKIKESLDNNISFFTAPPKFCTDNAAMIAGLAYHMINYSVSNSAQIDAYSKIDSSKEMLIYCAKHN